MSKPADKNVFEDLRMQMVATQIEARGVRDPKVLEALRKVPRHLFVPKAMAQFAYEDNPLAIGRGQTISQPYIVALMTELLEPKESDKILEIGTGSGYQTAVLSEIVNKIYTIEIVADLKERADKVFLEAGYSNIISRLGDGYYGWPEEAPFDGIIAAAAPERVPKPLLDQLGDGGKLVIPVGNGAQFLEVYTRHGNDISKAKNIPVKFVPMTGDARDR